MNLAGLALDNVPPIATPLRFFLVAPAFGLIAGVLAIAQPELFSLRWTPAAFAFTHLLTLGFGALVMLGALYQVLPVVSNRAIPGDRLAAPVVLHGIAWGTTALATGFLTSQGWLFGTALLLLALGFGLFVGTFGVGLVRARPAGETTVALRLATLCLVATIALGGVQLTLHLWPETGLYRSTNTQLHAFVGGFGWVLLLVMGVSFQVIPMFHVAPAFPGWTSRWLPPAMCVAIATVLLAAAPVVTVALALTMSATIAYALVALRLLAARKRKLVDYTVRFWQLGLTQLIGAAILVLVMTHAAPGAWRPSAEMLLGLIFGLGFVMSVMLGMLQKIVPFLIYLHLQRLALANATPVPLPHMKALLPTARMRWQYRLQLLLLPCAYAGPWSAWAGMLAGLLLAAGSGWLCYSLWGAWRQYRGATEEIARLT